MSKKNRQQNQQRPIVTSVEPSSYVVALKPRRGLLVVLSIIFALWVGLLLFLYFTTVYKR